MDLTTIHGDALTAVLFDALRATGSDGWDSPLKAVKAAARSVLARYLTATALLSPVSALMLKNALWSEQELLHDAAVDAVMGLGLQGLQVQSCGARN